MEKQLKNQMEHAMKHIAEEINSIEDDETFDINSVKMLYALPVNSFALVNKEDKIKCKVISAGLIENNKGVHIVNRKIKLKLKQIKLCK